MRSSLAVDWNSRVEYSVPMETLADRITQILEKRSWSRRELARKAGLAETHVSLILKKFQEDPNASIEDKTIRAIAHAAGVSAAWLQYGSGDPGWPDDEPAPAPEVPVTDQVPPAYEQIPGYHAMEAQARVIEPSNPEWAYGQFRRANPLRDASVPLSAASIAAMVKVIATYGTPPPDARNQKIKPRK